MVDGDMADLMRRHAEAIRNSMAAAAFGAALDPDVVVARLRDALPRFTCKNPFKYGDLVAAPLDAPIIGTGPRLVIEVRDVGPEFRSEDLGTPMYGARFDTRVLHIKEGVLAAYWTASENLELYTAPAKA